MYRGLEGEVGSPGKTPRPEGARVAPPMLFSADKLVAGLILHRSPILRADRLHFPVTQRVSCACLAQQAEAQPHREAESWGNSALRRVARESRQNLRRKGELPWTV